MKDGVGNEILLGDILHVRLVSENVIAKVVEVSGGMVVDPKSRKVKPEFVRIIIDMNLECPFEGAPVEFLPNAYKIHNPKKDSEDKARADGVIDSVEKKAQESDPLKTPPKPTMFLKRSVDIKDEKLNPTK